MYCTDCGTPVNRHGRFCAQCGASLNSAPPVRPTTPSTSTGRRAHPNIPAGALAPPREKSIALAVVLAALFGPVGLFYSSVIGGFIMAIVLILMAGALFFGGPSWILLTLLPVDVIWAAVAVYLEQQQAIAREGQDG
jgi:hypothetical protein